MSQLTDRVRFEHPRNVLQIVWLPVSGQYAIWVPNTPAKRGHTQRLRTRDRAEAQRLFDDCKIVDIFNASKADALTKQFWSRLVTGRDVTVSKAMDEYMAHLSIIGLSEFTILSYTNIIDYFIRSCRAGKSQIAAITSKHVSAHVNRTGISYASRRQTLRTINLFFEFCMKQNWIPINPCSTIGVQTRDLSHAQLVPVKKKPFTDEEIERLLAVAGDGFWRCAILIGRSIGARLSTVASLEWASIADGRITVFTHKAQVVVDEPLPDDVAKALFAQPRTDSPFVWPDKAALVMDLVTTRLTRQFARLCAKAGVVGRCYHCFRVMAVTRELDRQLDSLGGPEKAALMGIIAHHGMDKVRQLVGHASGSRITERYYVSAPT